jgi:hypothetical protein
MDRCKTPDTRELETAFKMHPLRQKDNSTEQSRFTVRRPDGHSLFVFEEI